MSKYRKLNNRKVNMSKVHTDRD